MPVTCLKFSLVIARQNRIRSPKFMAGQKSTISTERIERSILLIRGHKVMLDADLADLY